MSVSSQTNVGARLRLRVKSREDYKQRFASNLATGGMFVRNPRPPSVGSAIAIEFILPNEEVLSRVAAKVMHAKPAANAEDKTAGMGLQLMTLDQEARDAVASVQDVSNATDDSVAHKVESLDQAVATNELVLGIDLGTTNSCVAVVQDDKPKVLQASGGYETTPSVVYLTEEKKLLVGRKAEERMTLEPSRAVYGSKRFIGRPFQSKEIKAFGHFFSYGLRQKKDGLTSAVCEGVAIPLESVSAAVLTQIKRVAEQALGQQVFKAVVTVPAYFGERQRGAVREAGRLAGLDVVRVLNEPTAAAVAYGYGKGLERTIVVYDLGGGTFDVSVMRVEQDKMTVLASGGDAFLGGSDFDDRITEFVLMQVERVYKKDLRSDPVAIQRVRSAAEKAKRELSENPTTQIELPYLLQNDDGPQNFSFSIEREVFQRLTLDLVERSLDIVQSVLAEASLSSDQIDEIVLVGGQSRMPQIKELLKSRFGKDPARNVHPDHAVALGAALVAHGLRPQNDNIELVDILAASVWLDFPDSPSEQVFPRGQALPCEKTVEVPTFAAEKEYLVALGRGESSVPEQHEAMGQLRLPSNAAAAFAGVKASLRLAIAADGGLHAELTHPVTQETRVLDLQLPVEASGAEEVLDVDDLEIVAVS